MDSSQLVNRFFVFFFFFFETPSQKLAHNDRTQRRTGGLKSTSYPLGISEGLSGCVEKWKFTISSSVRLLTSYWLEIFSRQKVKREWRRMDSLWGGQSLHTSSSMFLKIDFFICFLHLFSFLLPSMLKSVFTI